MKSLLIYLKDYKKESVLAPLFKMLEATFELLVPLVMAAVIDVGIANSDRPYIVKNVLCTDRPGTDRTGLFDHGPVFLGEGRPRASGPECGMHYSGTYRR